MAESTAGRKGSSRRRPRGRNGASPVSRVLAAFYACGRCSYFLASYRATHGLDHLDAISQDGDDWLTLRWDERSRDLLEKSFGVRSDQDAYYLTVCCPECQRGYVYQKEDAANAFQVEVTPRRRH